jgi:hypothetical protein
MAKVRVFALPGGQIQIFVDEGTFAEAKAKTEALLAQLKAQGLPVDIVGQVEQHKDDVTHVHVTSDVHHHHLHVSRRSSSLRRV